MLHLRRLPLVSIACLVTVLSACGDVNEPSARVQVDAPTSSSTMTTTTTTIRIDWPAVERLAFVVWANKNAAADRRSAPAMASPATKPLLPQAAAAPSGDGCAEPIRSMLLAAFPDDQAWVIRTAMRESNCTAGAVNWREGCATNSHAMGTMQLCWPLHQRLTTAVGCSDVLDAECNIRMARYLYDEQGRRPWGG